MTCKLRPRKNKLHYLLPCMTALSWIFRTGEMAEFVCGKPGRTPDCQYRETKEHFIAGETVLYYCENNMCHNFGRSDRQCLKNGSWSGRIPVCYCPVELRSVVQSPLLPGYSVAYTIDGDPATCTSTDFQRDAYWEGHFTQNLDIRAVKLVLQNSAEVAIEIVIKAENSAEILCGRYTGSVDRNKELDIICQSTVVGKYVHIRDLSVENHYFELCEVTVFLKPEPHCLSPDIPMNGKGYKNFHRDQSEYIFSCFSGYELWGDSSVFCQPNGTWAPSSPICKKIYCSAPDSPANGSVTYDFDSGVVPYHGRANYSCNPGFFIKGSAMAICKLREKWSSNPPTCRELSSETLPQRKTYECGNLPHIANGVIIANSTAVGSSAWLVCNEGYKPLSDDKTECVSTGTWSASSLICAPIQCERNPVILHGSGILLDNSTFYGSRLQIICNRGYVASAPVIHMCEQTATWGDLDICIERSCGPINVEDFSRGQWLVLNDSASIRVLTCETGYLIEGSPVVMQCLRNGSWSYTSATCISSPEIDARSSEWSPSVMLLTAVAVGAGTAVCVICLAMSFLVIKKRRQSRTNTTVFHLGTTESSISKGAANGKSMSLEPPYYTTDVYEDVIELRHNPQSTKSRKPRSALPHLPLDADPVYAQPFEAASGLGKKLSTETTYNKDDLCAAHIYAEPVDSRRERVATNNISNYATETWLRTGTGKFGRKMSLPDCPPSSIDTGQNDNETNCAIYRPLEHSPTMSCSNNELYEKCQNIQSESERKDMFSELINNTIYLKTEDTNFSSSNNSDQVKMIENDIYLDDDFSNV